MNARTEVEDLAGTGSAMAAPDREAARSARPVPPKTGARGVMPGPGTGTADEREANRMSVDPLRGTDRYRLVAPLPLQF